MPLDRESLKRKAISDLSSYLDSVDEKHCNLLSYWISDYVRFLKKEEAFDSKRLIRYKRGSIVKAHLGYRIGSEEGGLHYAIVLDNQNALTSDVVTIIPLTSVKPSTDLEKLHHSSIYLGDEIYQNLTAKLDAAILDFRHIKEKVISDMAALAHSMEELGEKELPQDELLRELSQKKAEMTILREQIPLIDKKVNNLEKISKEISKMKRGSIALVSQITTISKIRIYDPLYPADALANIKISDESLNKIDDTIKRLYTCQKRTSGV